MTFVNGREACKDIAERRHELSAVNRLRGIRNSHVGLGLGSGQRKSHIITIRQSLTWFGVWFGLAMPFNVGIIFIYERGMVAGLEFFTFSRGVSGRS